MDLSKLSDKDILALKNNDYGSLSDEAVLMLKGSSQPQQAQPEEESILDKAKQIGGKALELTGRTLDFPGGLGRVAWTALEDIPAATGMVDRETTGQYPEDIYRALQGTAPTSEEYLKRQGAPDTTSTKATGIALDILKDPTTYMGIAPLKQLLSRASQKAGKNIYKSGLKAIDIEAAKYGKEPVSDVLLKEGITGSAEEIQKKMDDLARSYKSEVDSILKKADEAGGTVSMREAMEPVQQKINSIRATRDPNLQKLADTMEKDLQQYYKLERPTDTVMATTKPVTPSQASGFKSSEYSKIGDEAYKEASQTPVGKSLQKTKARGLKEAVEKSVEKVSGKQSAEELRQLNDKLGRLLTTDEKAIQEAAKEIRKNAVTSVDAPLAVLDPKAAIMKKLADVSKMTGPRTKAGKALMDRAKSNLLIEQNLLTSPWLTLQRQYQTKPEEE